MSKLTLLTIFSTIAASALAETVPSTLGEDTWSCVAHETAEVAFIGYCPATTRQGATETTIYDLTDETSNANYVNAPTSYQTSGSEDITLRCAYGDAENTARYECFYGAGGGATLHQINANEDVCNDAATPNPQPSPGVDYRRSLSRRADFPAPEFACPIQAATSGDYVTYTTIQRGQEVPAGHGDIVYSCYNNYGDASQAYYCSYDEEGNLFNPQNNKCPDRACKAVKDGIRNMFRRGVYVGEDPVRKRQARRSDIVAKRAFPSRR